MTRWSLRNAFMPVSHQEFVDYTKKFKQAAETSFGTACQLKIVALAEPKAYSTFWDDDLQSGLDKANRENTILETDTLDDVTPALWARAQYLEVLVKPVDETKAPQSAFAHAEFKGTQPHKATFYIQPGGEDARENMLSQSSNKVAGDGFDSNGLRSLKVPASLRTSVPLLSRLRKFIP